MKVTKIQISFWQWTWKYKKKLKYIIGYTVSSEGRIISLEQNLGSTLSFA